MKQIHLKKCRQTFTYRGIFTYLIVYNEAAGRKDRYEVLIPTSTDPVVVGRELPLDFIRNELIPKYESFAPSYWFGGRRPVLTMLRKVKEDQTERPSIFDDLNP